MTGEQSTYGLMAEFEDHEQVVAAAKSAYAEGYRRMDAYTPFPVEELAEALGHRWTAVPLAVLCGGIVGGAGGYFMEWYSMVVDYPLNVGGRPFHSWPAFVPIAFELTVLVAALSGFLAVMVLNGLPRPHHPVFNVPEFKRATTDRFFLCIEATDPKFNPTNTRRFLEDLKPASVREVKAE